MPGALEAARGARPDAWRMATHVQRAVGFPLSCRAAVDASMLGRATGGTQRGKIDQIVARTQHAPTGCQE